MSTWYTKWHIDWETYETIYFVTFGAKKRLNSMIWFSFALTRTFIEDDKQSQQYTKGAHNSADLEQSHTKSISVTFTLNVNHLVLLLSNQSSSLHRLFQT